MNHFMLKSCVINDAGDMEDIDSNEAVYPLDSDQVVPITVVMPDGKSYLVTIQSKPL